MGELLGDFCRVCAHLQKLEQELLRGAAPPAVVQSEEAGFPSSNMELLLRVYLVGAAWHGASVKMGTKASNCS